jgi:signal transduction histidine kinase
VITLVDVTALKRTEAALRESEGRLECRIVERTVERDALRRALSAAEEAERRRLSRELHDEVEQHLTSLGLGLQALSDVVPPGSEADRRAIQLRTIVDALARELHTLAVRLRPRALDDFGLEAALAAYAKEWSEQSGIAVDMHAAITTDRLPPEIESAVYRIVQEALTNVAKHSGATHSSVLVERRDGHVIAIIEDDGCGFDTSIVSENRQRSGGGLGLLGIRERAALLGGTLEIESGPGGGGTTLYVRIPIDMPRADLAKAALAEPSLDGAAGARVGSDGSSKGAADAEE